MLMKARSEFNPDNLAVNKGMLFTDFSGSGSMTRLRKFPQRSIPTLPTM